MTMTSMDLVYLSNPSALVVVVSLFESLDENVAERWLVNLLYSWFNALILRVSKVAVLWRSESDGVFSGIPRSFLHFEHESTCFLDLVGVPFTGNFSGDSSEIQKQRNLMFFLS